MWLLTSHPWELQSHPYKPDTANLSQDKGQETGAGTILCPLKPSPGTSPSAVLPPYPIPPPPPPLNPQPDTLSQLFPTHPATLPPIKSSRRRHWLPALRETQAGSWRWAPTQLQLHTLDSPTVPRLVLLPGCLNVPVADASHMSALVSVLLKMGSGFSHLCKDEVCVCTQASLLSLPLVLFHLPL